VTAWSSRLRTWARELKREAHALYLAARDPRVPLIAKIVAGAVAAYAFSPIDLIPDFIPILGMLDDLLIVPLGILLARRLVPPAMLAEHRATALAAEGKPVSRTAALVIAAMWLAGIVFAVLWAWHHLA
jgi:uncharacterized membrane protein YkvA (DUF1232 family)